LQSGYNVALSESQVRLRGYAKRPMLKLICREMLRNDAARG
jgi:hypothetical protein